jgi:hypothetical protein
MSLLRGPWVGQKMPNRADLRSDDMLNWLKQNIASARKVLFQQNTGFTGSLAAGETVMGSYTLPGGLVAQVEEGLALFACGLCAATANNKTITAYIGGLAGTSIHTTGAAAANNKPWSVEATITRSADATSFAYAESWHNASKVAPTRTTGGPSLKVDQSLAVSATTPTANNDALMDYLIVERMQSWNLGVGA